MTGPWKPSPWDWDDDLVVCTWHRRFLPCRRCYDDPREGSWSSELSDVLAVERYQKGLDDD
jgi:hypothetical protein